MTYIESIMQLCEDVLNSENPILIPEASFTNMLITNAGTSSMDSPDKCPVHVFRYWQTPNGYTTVEWTDHTKTTVKRSDGKASSEDDLFTAVCIAYAKRMFGSTSNIMREIDNAQKTMEFQKLKKEREREQRKALQAAKRKAEKNLFEKRVQARLEQMRINDEARRRLIKEQMRIDNEARRRLTKEQEEKDELV